MSTNLRTATSEVNDDVQVTSFSGGPERGRCLQLAQRHDGHRSRVHMTRAQVEEMVNTMNYWLAGNV